MTRGMDTTKKTFHIPSVVGKLVTIRQNDLRRFYLREQPVGTWVGQIPPWTTLATCKGTCKVTMDQCTTGLRDSHGVLMRETYRDKGQPPSLTCTFGTEAVHWP
eukprot:8083902-Pyramimonas_sp.AAC.1